MTLRREFLTAVLAIVIFTITLGFIYPMLVTGVSQGLFPGRANGSLIKRGGVVVGSALIGQQFYENVIGKNGKPVVVKGVVQTQPDPRYFQTRPSATVPSDNAAATTFSNYGPNQKTTLAFFQANIATYLQLEKPYDPGLTVAKIPVDAINSSASGVDPNISVANADIQAHRIAALRNVSLATVDNLVAKYTTGRSLGFLGEPGVNVLELNLALDRLTGSR